MPQSYHKRNNNDGLSTQQNLEKIVDELKKTNQELREARRAALNLMEDAISSKEALRKSEEKYRSLFNSIDEGFHIIELIYNDAGKAIDFRYIETNKSFERHTGLKNAAGKLGSEITSNTEDYWFEAYETVARSGEPLRFENYNEFIGRWYSAYAFRLPHKNGCNVAVLFNDITERKRREQQQQYILKLSDALRNLSDSVIIQKTAVQLLGEHMQVNRAFYGDMLDDEDTLLIGAGYVHDVSPLEGYVKFSEFDSDLVAYYRRGQTVVISDIGTDFTISDYTRTAMEAIQVRGAIGIPLLKAGKVKGILSIHQSHPRKWTLAEITLVEETAERTWAAMQQAKAETSLRQSEEKYRSIFNSINEGFCIYELVYDNEKAVDLRWVEVNPAYEKQTGLKNTIGKLASEVMPGTESHWLEIYDRVAKTGAAVHFENWHEPTRRWYNTFSSRIGGADSRQVAVVFADVTERKNQEQRQELLLRISDMLQHISDPAKIQESAMQALSEQLGLSRAYYFRVTSDDDGWIHIIESAYQQDSAQPGMIGSHSLKPFGSWLFDDFEHGKIVEVPDISAVGGLTEIELGLYRRIGAIAFLNVPLLRNGVYSAGIAVHSPVPRNWTKIEISLIKEVAERIWAAVEKVRAEEALHKSEERFRSFVTASSDTVYKMSADWQVMYQLKGKNFLADTDSPNSSWMDNYIPEYEKPRIRKAIEEAIKNKSIFELEHQVYDADNNIGWTLSRAVPILNGKGEIIEWLGAASDITQRKKAEEALRQSEERLQLSLRGANIFTWEVNPPTGDTQFSANYNEVLGFEISENTQVNYLNIHPDDKDFVARAIDRALKGEASLDVEHRIINPKTKELVWIRAQGQLTKRSVDARPVFIGITQNITTRKIAVEALRTSEERLQKAIQIETVGVIFFNDEGRITEVNNAFSQMSGYTPAQVNDLQLSLKDITPPEWIPAMEKALQEIMAYGIATPYEKELLRADGSRWWGLCAKARIGKNDNVEYVVDVTQRRRAEKALHQSEERYRVALLSANMAAWDWRIAEDRITWNEQHYYLLGLQPDGKEKKSADFIQFVHEADAERITRALQEAVEKTGLYQAEFRIVRADNKQVCWMSGYGRAFEKNGSKTTRMIGVMYDITERKSLELQKEDFIGIASHELKTPVTSIKAYTEVLQEMYDEGDYETGSTIIKKLDAQVDRLIELVHALLDVTKITGGELPLQIEQFNLAALVRERAEDLGRVSTIHHILIKPEKEIFVNADRERISQVLTNLISNAIKYSPKGGEININWKQTKTGMQVSLQDEGIGISEEMQAKVFERFYRTNDVRVSTFPGMGLGLYIAANIIGRHGGKIWVESKPDKGSTFYFTLPAAIKFSTLYG